MNKRNSMQKQMIAGALNMLNHPTTAQIYGHIGITYPHISMGTVYRNLNTMVEENKAARLSFPNQPDRFDICTHRHYHILCSQCGEVFDIENIPEQILQKLERGIEASTGFTVSEHRLYFSGVCPVCRKLRKAF